jgi:hypothetical protein
MTAYQEGLKSILDESDWQSFTERKTGEKRRFLKRSGWRKIAFWFGLDLQIISSEVERDANGNPLRARVIARATHPNGRRSDGDGYCSIRERGFSKPENDIPATAATRAINRAISNLVGMGDVSAEEVEGAEVLEQPYGPAATPREQSGAERATQVIYDPDYDPDPLLTRLRTDAGGYLPKVVARAVMLIAAHRPGRSADNEAGTDADSVPPQDDTVPEQKPPQTEESDNSEEVIADSGAEPEP